MTSIIASVVGGLMSVIACVAVWLLGVSIVRDLGR